MCNKDRNVVSRLSAGIGFSRIPGLVVELDIIPAAQVCKQAAEEIQRGLFIVQISRCLCHELSVHRVALIFYSACRISGHNEGLS